MITYSDSFLVFLCESKNKIAKTLFNARYCNYPSYRLMLTTDEINYLSLRADGNISYLPAGRQLRYNADGEWSRHGRQDGKPAKVIRKLFTKKALKVFEDSDFEGFANSYKAKFSDSLSFQIRINRDIPLIYDMEIAPGGGSLNSSCMNGDGDYMDIYNYCKSLRILILIDEEGQLCGRALIWDLEDNITLMDRIYVVSDFMYELFIAYAVDSGWWHKKDYRSQDDKDVFINEKGEEVVRHFVVKTDTDFSSYPYIDTFTYGDTGSLKNYESGRFTYANSDGTRIGEYWDEIDECWLDEDDAVLVTHGIHSGDRTHFDNTANVGAQVWWSRDPGIAEVDGCFYRVEDTVLSDYDGARHLKSDCVWTDIHGSYILKCDSVVLDGEIYHKNALIDLQRA
jgi:hypothetical protein